MGSLRWTLRRAGSLALAIFGVAFWQLGCSDSQFGLTSGVRIDQLGARDLSVDVTDTSALLTWLTRDAGQTTVNFGLDFGLGTIVTGAASTTSHQLTLTGLSAGTTYYFQITGSGVTYRFRTNGGTRQRIAFVSDRSDTRQEVYLAYENGENVVRVTNGGGITPALSRDGTRLAFAGPGAGGMRDIFELTLDAAGVVAGSLINRTNTPGRDETEPDWSPDNSQLVFIAAEPNQPSQVILRDMASSAESVLVNNGATNSGPKWRPNGTQIAFASTTRSATVQLGVRPVTAGSVVVTLNEPGGGVIDPSQYQLISTTDGLVDFSGSTVTDRDILVSYTGNGAAITNEGHHVPRPHLEIWSIQPDGLNLRRLTSSGDRQARFSPCWHPTQNLILHVAESGTATNLFGVGGDGGATSGVTRGAYNDRGPCVAPDGSAIMFSSNRHIDGLVNLYRSDFSGNTDAVNLFSSGDTQPSWSVVP